MVNNISPILFLGIGIYIFPVVLGIIHVNIPKNIYTVGLVTIVIGVIHTVIMRGKQ